MAALVAIPGIRYFLDIPQKKKKYLAKSSVHAIIKEILFVIVSTIMKLRKVLPMKFHKIPNETIQRLPMYLRVLQLLYKQGTNNISSLKLGEFLDVNSWQARKDFSYFGSFGTPGVGYDVKKLVRQISKILKLNVAQKVALIGLGNLGSAIQAYGGFNIYGFEVVAIFDIDPKKIGTKKNNIIVENVSRIKLLKNRKIDLSIVAVPSSAAQDVVDALVKAGVKGILNFAPCHLKTPKKVKIINIDIATDLACLPYYIPTARRQR
ncbi:MAG: redox-sensing transcriptional repressor Rex [Sedimentisphaerales bacterium]|nr:redox-sensing transcriptional repressor Rex [Sedimentisphaerales bacterium]